MLSVHALLLPTPLSFEMFSHMRSDREPCVNLVSECTIQVHVLVIAHISLPVVYDARLRGSAACNSLSRDRISVCRGLYLTTIERLNCTATMYLRLPMISLICSSTPVLWPVFHCMDSQAGAPSPRRPIGPWGKGLGGWGCGLFTGGGDFSRNDRYCMWCFLLPCAPSS